MKKKISLMLCLLAAAGLLMTGCSGNNSDATSSTASEISQPQTDLTIGQEQEDAYQVAMDNQIGQDITAVAVKLTSEESYPASLMEEGQTWSQGETALVCYLPGEAAASQTESGAAVNDGYEMQLTLADGSILEFTTVPFADMDACTLHLEDGVPYLEYTSLSSQEEVSTQETEAAAIALAQQQAQEAAAAQAAAEQAAAEQAAAEQAAQEAAAAAEAQRQAQAAEQRLEQEEAQRQQQAAQQQQAAATPSEPTQQTAQQQAIEQAQAETNAQQEQGQEQEEQGCLAGALIS